MNQPEPCKFDWKIERFVIILPLIIPMVITLRYIRKVIQCDTKILI